MQQPHSNLVLIENTRDFKENYTVLMSCMAQYNVHTCGYSLSLVLHFTSPKKALRSKHYVVKDLQCKAQ